MREAAQYVKFASVIHGEGRGSGECTGGFADSIIIQAISNAVAAAARNPLPRAAARETSALPVRATRPCCCEGQPLFGQA